MNTLGIRHMLPMIKDYLYILLGLVIYSIGYSCFILPYQITSGGVSGIAALIFYGSGFNAAYSFLIINIFLMVLALKTMGWRYCVRTLLAILVMSFMIDYAQTLLYDGNGHMIHIVGEQKFMACVLGGCMDGIGMGFVFLGGGSTGGTDIIASAINKHHNISLGRILLTMDILIVSCNWLVIHDMETLVVSYSTMFIAMNMLDYVINGARQSIQFLIISERYETIATRINNELDRGVTVLDGRGWYSGERCHVLLVLAKKYERRDIYRLIQSEDPKAFVSMSNVEGVFGEGFEKIKK